MNFLLNLHIFDWQSDLFHAKCIQFSCQKYNFFICSPYKHFEIKHNILEYWSYQNCWNRASYGALLIIKQLDIQSLLNYDKQAFLY